MVDVQSCHWAVNCSSYSLIFMASRPVNSCRHRACTAFLRCHPLLPPLPPAPPPLLPHRQEVANFFVSEARRNFHAPADQAEEEDLLIYNWAPSYTGKVGEGCMGGWGGRGGS